MKNKPLILAALAITALAAGCKQSNSVDQSPATATNSTSAITNAWQQTKEAATNAWANTKEATTNAWADLKDSMQTSKDYTYDKKDAFVAGARADLDALDQKIKELSAKADTTGDSVKADAQIKLQELRAKRADLDVKLDAVKNATAADWDDTKVAFQNSYDDAKNSLKQAWQWLTDKLNS
jgi:hypothetical protein